MKGESLTVEGADVASGILRLHVAALLMVVQRARRISCLFSESWYNNMNRLILASNSPRRREILAMVGYEFDVCVPKVDEAFDQRTSHSQIPVILSARKAAAVAKAHPQKVVVGADTIVVLDDRILGKPGTPQAACEMLSALSGRRHMVYTGYTICQGERMMSGCAETEVRFRLLRDEEIQAYVASGAPMDKAGGYGIQDKGALFIEGITGDYYTVMGIPLSRVAQDLKDYFDIDPWQHRTSSGQYS
jgi:septum formation protein